MAAVTGTLRDFGLEALATSAPRIIFAPSGNAVLGPYLLATTAIIVTPDTPGTFTANLAPTTDTVPDCWYNIRIEWLDPYNSTSGYIGMDLLDWALRVPPEGGDISTLLSIPSNPAQVWIDSSPPANPTPGTWWLDPSTGDLMEWS